MLRHRLDWKDRAAVENHTRRHQEERGWCYWGQGHIPADMEHRHTLRSDGGHSSRQQHSYSHQHAGLLKLELLVHLTNNRLWVDSLLVNRHLIVRIDCCRHLTLWPHLSPYHSDFRFIKIDCCRRRPSDHLTTPFITSKWFQIFFLYGFKP